MSTKENNMKEETSIKDEEVVNKESEDTPIETNAEGETSENKEGLDTSEEQHALSLEEQLESLKNELNESRDRYLRLMAEFDNYRKRVLREKTELILNGGERVITSMLPILDDFERVEKSMAETDDLNSLKEGVNLVIEKFRTSLEKDYPLDHLWALLHAIHTTADFEMEKILYTDNHAVEMLFNKVKDGSLKTIVTDVTMVTSGIRKGALQRLGVEAKCYLSDPRVAELTKSPLLCEGSVQDSGRLLTRTQAGIRLAVEEHPDALFAFGNAPTALMELCDLIRKGKAHPAGIIAAPVGFVHVRESKHMVKPFHNIPKIIVEGRKGGSNLAATLCNAILTFDDAEQLKPGRDL